MSKVTSTSCLDSFEGSCGNRDDGDPLGVRVKRGERGGDRRSPLPGKRGEMGGDLVRDKKGGMPMAEAGESSKGESSTASGCVGEDVDSRGSALNCV
jgi:hypothetical protein